MIETEIDIFITWVSFLLNITNNIITCIGIWSFFTGRINSLLINL